jgi:hypothetical protein
VFLEPAEWDDELQGSRPVIQLDVSIKHFIGERATDGPIAVEKSSLPCMPSFPTLSVIFTHQLCIVGTVLWSVSKSTANPDVVRLNIAGAHQRASYPLFLPRGVNLRQMEQFWHELQFNPVAPVEVPFKAELFHRPPKNIRLLRQIARKGRRRLELSIRKQKRRPKLVLGIPNDAQKVAPLLALAHGPGLVQTVSRSNLDAVDNTTTNLSENQKQTTQNPQTAALIDTSCQPSRTTEQTTQIHAVLEAKPFAQDTNTTGSGDFIPETKSVHSEEILSEDQR